MIHSGESTQDLKFVGEIIVYIAPSLFKTNTLLNIAFVKKYLVIAIVANFWHDVCHLCSFSLFSVAGRTISQVNDFQDMF